MYQPECTKTYFILGNEITYISCIGVNNCLFYIVRIEMSNSQVAQTTKGKTIYTGMYFRAQMWSLKTEGGKMNIVTSMWDITANLITA